MTAKNSPLELTKSEELWLNEIYKLFLENVFKPDIKSLKRKIMSQLNPHFDPSNINSIYLKNGNKITPFGIKHIDPKTYCFQEIDLVIKAIKNLLNDSEIKKIRIKDLSKITKLSISKLSQLLHLISTFDGSNFWSGHGYENNGNFIYINVDSEDVIDEYISYIDIEDYLKKENFMMRAFKSILERNKNEKNLIRAKDHTNIFVEDERIVELKKIKTEKFDLSKLAIFLIRSILDHIPPIFGEKSFIGVVSNLSKSTKEILDKLENTSRKIADKHLHTQISKKQTLPNARQISFYAELDFLLCEIIEKLTTE
jgi:hypothetical protein